jgi:predicted acyltransferase (DUF342 family)
MRRFPILFLAGALAFGLPMLAAAKVNGSVLVEAGQAAADASTVNGSVRVAAGAVVLKASTVNGSITLGDRAKAQEVGTVNGSITLGSGSRVAGDVHAVNGRIQLGNDADVAGKLHNVNGTILLDHAHVAGGISTVNSDLTVGAGSHVEGGILFEKPGGWFNWSANTPPVVVIGPHALVQGTLEFHRDVVLKVSDSAQIGPVKGATVEKFSGATP